MKTPVTPHELASAITRNAELFWHRRISYETFTWLAMDLWDVARDNGVHDEVQRIVSQLMSAKTVAVDVRGATPGTVFVFGGLECSVLRVRETTIYFQGEEIPASEILYRAAGCETPQMRTMAHGAKLSVRP